VLVFRVIFNLLVKLYLVNMLCIDNDGYLTASKAQWSTTATATERMLAKPLSLGDRLRFEFGVDPLDDKKSGELLSSFGRRELEN